MVTSPIIGERPRMLWLTSTLSNLVEAHLERPTLDEPGLVDDAQVGDVGLVVPAMEPGLRVQYSAAIAHSSSPQHIAKHRRRRMSATE